VTDFPHPFTAQVTDRDGNTSEVSDTVTFDFPAQGCYVDRAIEGRLHEQGFRVTGIDR